MNGWKILSITIVEVLTRKWNGLEKVLLKIVKTLTGKQKSLKKSYKQRFLSIYLDITAPTMNSAGNKETKPKATPFSDPSSRIYFIIISMLIQFFNYTIFLDFFSLFHHDFMLYFRLCRGRVNVHSAASSSDNFSSFFSFYLSTSRT